MKKLMTREQLGELVNEISRDMPRLLADYPKKEEFWEAFNGLSEVGFDRAEPEDRAWFEEELRALVHLYALDKPGTWTE